MVDRYYPLVSCIIPAYNSKKFIIEALNSAINQTYRNIEIIVVDDGSTDGTKSELEKYKNQIKYYYIDHQGPAAARNRGIAEASGEYIAFLDADDIWELKKIELQVKVFQEYPDVSICFTEIKNFWMPEMEHERERTEKEQLVRLIHPFSNSTFMGKKSVFDLVGVFNPQLIYGEDSDLYSRMDKAGLVNKVINQCLVYRRLHENNLTRTTPYFSKNEIMQKAIEALINSKKS